MMTILMLLACQDAPTPFRATMTIERFARREDRVRVDTGDLAVRPGEALIYESRTLKLLLKERRGIERHGGERRVTAWDLSKPENFQPLDLWRLAPAAVRELFQEVEDRADSPRPLPPAVVSPEGRPLPAVGVRPAAESLAWADGVDRGDGCRRVILVPRDARLRSRITSIRLSVDCATGRILRVVVDSPAQVLTLTLGDCQEAASLEDAVFVWDFSGLKVEER
ncbi:MAG TPA: hypothetical protein VE981_23655 [Planctomycetota bacterium]|nr:hypothetical protein [Planctomycetota bacterium]